MFPRLTSPFHSPCSLVHFPHLHPSRSHFATDHRRTSCRHHRPLPLNSMALFPQFQEHQETWFLPLLLTCTLACIRLKSPLCASRRPSRYAASRLRHSPRRSMGAARPPRPSPSRRVGWRRPPAPTVSSSPHRCRRRASLLLSLIASRPLACPTLPQHRPLTASAPTPCGLRLLGVSSHRCLCPLARCRLRCSSCTCRLNS